MDDILKSNIYNFLVILIWFGVVVYDIFFLVCGFNIIGVFLVLKIKRIG